MACGRNVEQASGISLLCMHSCHVCESSKLSSIATSRSQRRAWPLSGIGGSTCEDEVDFRGFVFRGSYSTDDNPWKRTKTLEGSFSSSKLDGPLMEGQFQVKDDNPR